MSLVYIVCQEVPGSCLVFAAPFLLLEIGRDRTTHETADE